MTDPTKREKRYVIFDVLNEQAVLGAALVDAEVRRHVVRRLAPDMFLSPQHEALARALRECENRSMDPTPQALAACGEADRWGGDGYVAVLRDAAAPRRNLKNHVEMLKWDSTRARLLKGAHATLTEKLLDARVAPDDVKAAARAVVQGLDGWGSRRHMHDGQALAREWLADFAVRRAGGGFVETGWAPVDDKLTRGMVGGEVTVLAGISGVGKSTTALNWCLRLAELETKCLYCAWEGGSKSILDSMVAVRSGVTLWRVVRSNLCTEEEVDRVREATKWVTDRVRFMDNAFFERAQADDKRGPRYRNEHNLDLFEGYLAESGCSVVFCDLWERLLAERDPERDVVPALYRQHRMFEEYDCHGVLLNQINLKEAERRAINSDNPKPTKGLVKGTAGYVEVADVLFGLYRDADDPEWMQGICLKQRGGASDWAVRWRYDRPRRRLSDPEECAYDANATSSGSMPDPNRSVGQRPSGRRRKSND